MNDKVKREIDEIIARKMVKSESPIPGTSSEKTPQSELPFNMCDLDGDYCSWKHNCHTCGKGVANGR